MGGSGCSTLAASQFLPSAGTAGGAAPGDAAPSSPETAAGSIAVWGRGAARLAPGLAQAAPQAHSPGRAGSDMPQQPWHHRWHSHWVTVTSPCSATARVSQTRQPARVPAGSAQLCGVPRCPPGSAGAQVSLQAVPSCAGCPGVPQAVPSCSAQMLVPGQATGLSVRRALRAQQRRQEARLPCEHTAPSFMAKNSPPGRGPAWKSPLQPRPAHVYSVRGGTRTALPLPAGPARHLPARAAALGRGSLGPPRPKHTGWGGGDGKPLKSTGFVSGRSSPR